MDWPNHIEPWRQWDDAMASARMHHGWMLAGKSGLGKLEFALAAARILVAEPGVAQPSGEHPDIITLSHLPKDEKEEKKRDEGKPYQTKRNIAVAQIRSMQRRLNTRPTIGERRAIIINPADDMETSASNALLKSLEEPPKGTFFLLVTHRPSRLLPTIRSRCRVLRFPVLDRVQLDAMLDRSAGDHDLTARETAIQAAGGSYGSALRFLEQDLGSVARTIQSILDHGDTNFAARAELARSIGPRADRGRIQAVLELAQTVVAEQAKSAHSTRRRESLIDAHLELVRLAGQAPSYNFDTGLLVLEIGTLLVNASAASEPAHG